MDRLEKIKQKALERILTKENLSEGRMKYPEGLNVRIHPSLEKQLRGRKHSLGNHPIFPNSEEIHFEEKIIQKRFENLVNNYKRQFDTETIEQDNIINDLKNLLDNTIRIENKNKKELEDLAIKMVMDEYDINDDDIEITAELTTNINDSDIIKNPSPVSLDDMEFDNHDSLEKAEKEVYKRRFINALIQGAAKKGHHMFHMAEDEITKINPTLPNKYSKIMAGADLLYLLTDDKTHKTIGGVVRVDFSNDKPKIHAKAMTFPVLIHELIKGVMEILSTHGLPEDEKLMDYVLAKADFMNAEPWDMRLGPALWEKFVDCIDHEHFDKKHHLFAELVSLPVDEFNYVMREIMLGSKEGKNRVKEMIDDINAELEKEAYEDAIRKLNSSDDIMRYDDLDDIDLNGLF